MKKLCFMISVLTLLAIVPARAAEPFSWHGLTPDEKAANMNRDDYPYSVMNRPLLPPEERRKLRRQLIRYEQYRQKREADIAAQFRAMSADERRYVIEHQGFPLAVQPGLK